MSCFQGYCHVLRSVCKPGFVYFLTFWYKPEERSLRVALILASRLVDLGLRFLQIWWSSRQYSRRRIWWCYRLWNWQNKWRSWSGSLEMAIHYWRNSQLCQLSIRSVVVPGLARNSEVAHRIWEEISYFETQGSCIARVLVSLLFFWN